MRRNNRNHQQPRVPTAQEKREQDLKSFLRTALECVPVRDGDWHTFSSIDGTFNPGKRSRCYALERRKSRHSERFYDKNFVQIFVNPACEPTANLNRIRHARISNGGRWSTVEHELANVMLWPIDIHCEPHLCLRLSTRQMEWVTFEILVYRYINCINLNDVREIAIKYGHLFSGDAWHEIRRRLRAGRRRLKKWMHIDDEVSLSEYVDMDSDIHHPNEQDLHEHEHEHKDEDGAEEEDEMGHEILPMMQHRFSLDYKWLIALPIFKQLLCIANKMQECGLMDMDISPGQFIIRIPDGLTKDNITWKQLVQCCNRRKMNKNKQWWLIKIDHESLIDFVPGMHPPVFKSMTPAYRAPGVNAYQVCSSGQLIRLYFDLEKVSVWMYAASFARLLFDERRTERTRMDADVDGPLRNRETNEVDCTCTFYQPGAGPYPYPGDAESDGGNVNNNHNHRPQSRHTWLCDMKNRADWAHDWGAMMKRDCDECRLEFLPQCLQLDPGLRPRLSVVLSNVKQILHTYNTSSARFLDYWVASGGMTHESHSDTVVYCKKIPSMTSYNKTQKMFANTDCCAILWLQNSRCESLGCFSYGIYTLLSIYKYARERFYGSHSILLDNIREKQFGTQSSPSSSNSNSNTNASNTNSAANANININININTNTNTNNTPSPPPSDPLNDFDFLDNNDSNIINISNIMDSCSGFARFMKRIDYVNNIAANNINTDYEYRHLSRMLISYIQYLSKHCFPPMNFHQPVRFDLDWTEVTQITEGCNSIVRTIAHPANSVYYDEIPVRVEIYFVTAPRSQASQQKQKQKKKTRKRMRKKKNQRRFHHRDRNTNTNTNNNDQSSGDDDDSDDSGSETEARLRQLRSRDAEEQEENAREVEELRATMDQIRSCAGHHGVGRVLGDFPADSLAGESNAADFYEEHLKHRLDKPIIMVVDCIEEQEQEQDHPEQPRATEHAEEEKEEEGETEEEDDINHRRSNNCRGRPRPASQLTNSTSTMAGSRVYLLDAGNKRNGGQRVSDDRIRRFPRLSLEAQRQNEMQDKYLSVLSKHSLQMVYEIKSPRSRRQHTAGAGRASVFAYCKFRGAVSHYDEMDECIYWPKWFERCRMVDVGARYQQLKQQRKNSVLANEERMNAEFNEFSEQMMHGQSFVYRSAYDL